MDFSSSHVPIPVDPVATRASLIKRIRNWDDDESWQQFFQTYWRLIYALAIRHGLDESEAEEVVQATIIAVSKNIRTFNYDPNTGSFRQWLIHQARWRISDRHRQRAREQEVFARAPRRQQLEGAGTRTATSHSVPDCNNATELGWEAEWQESVHIAALTALKSQLNPKHYQVFDLYVLRHWPSERVRRTLGVGLAQMHLINTRVKRLYRRECARIEETLGDRPPSTESKPPA